MKIDKITIGASEHNTVSYRGCVYFWVNGVKLNWYETSPYLGIDRKDALKSARKLRSKIMQDMDLMEIPFLGTPVIV